jgi:hypothetical protein
MQQFKDPTNLLMTIYVRLLVNRVELSGDEIRIFGTKDALERR